MSVPVLTFFNNKSGVGKTSLVYHVAWMLAEQGFKVLVVDLDPQANLTAAFLDEDELAELWSHPSEVKGSTIAACLKPLSGVGDLKEPQIRRISNRLSLIPGDLNLAAVEDELSEEWPKTLGRPGNLYRPYRWQTAFWQVLQKGAADCVADIALVDVGPSLGAINRAALIATDYIVVPLGADLFSLQGLHSLGLTLARWRADWQQRLEHIDRLDRKDRPGFDLPQGGMKPLGYVVQQPGIRLSRPVAAYDRWVRRIPNQYSRCVLEQSAPDPSVLPDNDPNRIAVIKHYRSLVPLAQEARKPIFSLTAADGAIGSHSTAAREAYREFASLTDEILGRMKASGWSNPSPAG